MKSLELLTSTLLVTSVFARSIFSSGDNQSSIQESNISVPGENPLQYCKKPDRDILEIDHVDLDPNPPQAGKTLTITATGTFNEDIEEGAQVHLQVKYGLITIIRQTADLCDTIKNVDLECPLKKGEMTLTKDVELPKEIPPGKYTVLADVFTKDQDKITCLTATVTFSRQGKAYVDL